MYWAILIGCNIPVYAFLAWLIFDSKDGAANGFLAVFMTLLRMSSVVARLRAIFDPDDDEGMFDSVLFLVTCILFTIGEHWLLQKYWFV